MYMHTIDGRPATYHNRQQIVLKNTGRYPRNGAQLAASLTQIQEEQAASAAWRKKNGYESSAHRYSYVRVEVPDVR